MKRKETVEIRFSDGDTYTRSYFKTISLDNLHTEIRRYVNYLTSGDENTSLPASERPEAMRFYRVFVDGQPYTDHPNTKGCFWQTPRELDTAREFMRISRIEPSRWNGVYFHDEYEYE